MKLAISCLALAACAPLELGSDIESSTVSSYSYDEAGLPPSPIPLDNLGRALSVNGASLAYGPDGALAHAQHGTTSIDYITDEEGHRIAKRVNGVFAEAYVEEGLVTNALAMPLRIAGVTVGIVQGGHFDSLATDARGTLLADDVGVTRAKAFGERDRVANAAIDYAQRGRDRDLGVIRMGVRDYDPATHRFLTPDPLFLTQPDKCVESPVECNLYSYAKNRPADFVDPKGTNAVPAPLSPADPGPVPQGYLAQQEYARHLMEKAEQIKSWNQPHASFEKDAPSSKLSPYEQFVADGDMLRNAGPMGILVMGIGIIGSWGDDYMDERWLEAVHVATTLGDTFLANFGHPTDGVLSTIKPEYLPTVPPEIRKAVDSGELKVNMTKHNTY